MRAVAKLQGRFTGWSPLSAGPEPGVDSAQGAAGGESQGVEEAKPFSGAAGQWQ